MGGRSYCPQCRKTIAWHDNIPVLSFLILNGRCRHCHQKISWQYPLVELAVAVLLTLVFLKDWSQPQLGLVFWRDALLLAGLTIVFVYDWRWQMIPMLVIWPLMFIILILNFFLGFSASTLLSFGFVGALFFLIQYIITKKRGIGEGDIWLGLFLGLAFASGPKLLMLLIISYGLGALIGLFLILSGQKNRQSQIALGPFLAFGAIITLIWGEAIINWYFSLL